MAKRKLTKQLIHKNNINEDLYLIENSDTDYITKNGNVYTYYGNEMYLLRAKTLNKINGYIYVNVRFNNGLIKQKRLHKLIAEHFIPKDNAEKNIVMHIDNDKTNNDIKNLKWGTISENTKQAYDDNLAVNAKGFEDSQSIQVVVFDLNKNIINICGSVSIASKHYNVTKSGIMYQCLHKVKNTSKSPKCGYYFRLLKEYEEKGFIL